MAGAPPYKTKSRMEEDRTGYVTGAGTGTGNATATGMPICLYLCIRNNINCNEF